MSSVSIFVLVGGVAVAAVSAMRGYQPLLKLIKVGQGKLTPGQAVNDVAVVRGVAVALPAGGQNPMGWVDGVAYMLPDGLTRDMVLKRAEEAYCRYEGLRVIRVGNLDTTVWEVRGGVLHKLEVEA